MSCVAFERTELRIDRKVIITVQVDSSAILFMLVIVIVVVEELDLGVHDRDIRHDILCLFVCLAAAQKVGSILVCNLMHGLEQLRPTQLRTTHCLLLVAPFVLHQL